MNRKLEYKTCPHIDSNEHKNVTVKYCDTCLDEYLGGFISWINQKELDGVEVLISFGEIKKYKNQSEDEYCMCGGTKLDEHDFCRDCI